MLEGYFDNQRDYPVPYIEYLIHFHGDRDWFECHEILEEHWKKEGLKNKIWVALIQIAVGLYHQRRGNSKGALKMIGSAITHLDRKGIQELGLDYEELVSALEVRLKAIEIGNAFTDFNLPIMDHSLVEKCKQECDKRNLVWEADSRLDDAQLIHRHTLRDRSDVIEARRVRQMENKSKRQDEKEV